MTAAGLLWLGAAPPMEVRTRADGDEWRPWEPVYEEDDAAPASGERASALLIFPPAVEAELRVADQAAGENEVREDALTPALSQRKRGLLPSALRVVLIDSSVQPATQSAVRPHPNPLPEGEGPVVFTAAQVGAPRIISRTEWGADPAIMTWPPSRSTVRKFVVHHTATSDGGTDPAAAIRAIYHYHAVVLGWGDIGYNYIIDRSGNIYEGRAGGPNATGAHTGDHNTGADGIALLGNHQTAPASDPAVASLVALIAWRSVAERINPMGSSFFVDRALPNVFGHRDVNDTQCPGDTVYALLPAIRQRAAALVASQLTRPNVAVAGARITPLAISSGDTVRVDVTLRNLGNEPLRTQGPDPGVVYGETDTYRSLGHPDQPGRIRVGVQLDPSTGSGQGPSTGSGQGPSTGSGQGPSTGSGQGPSPGSGPGQAPDHQVRWGLGRDLAPGETRTVSGFIRFTRTGARSLVVGVVNEGVEWLHDGLGRATVTVYPPGAASYAATANPSPELYFPLAMRANNGWSTRLVLTNASAAQAASGRVSFIGADGRAAASVPLTLPPRGSTTIDLGALRQAQGERVEGSPSGLGTRDSVLPDGFVGAAVAQADAPLAGVAFHERLGSDRLAVEPFTSGAQRLHAPLVARNYNGLSTGIQVQNLGSAPTGVSVTYLADSGANWTEGARVASMASATFYAPAHRLLPDGFVGSAVIESDDGQPLAAQVNEVRADGMAMAYPAQAAGSASVGVPLLFRNRNGWTSGLQVQNLGSQTNVVATFRGVAEARVTGAPQPPTPTQGTGTPQPPSPSPGPSPSPQLPTPSPQPSVSTAWEQRGAIGHALSATFYLPALSQLPDNLVASATVRSLEGQPLLALANNVHAAKRIGAVVIGLPEGGQSLYVPAVFNYLDGWRTGVQVQNRGAEPAPVTLTFTEPSGVVALRLEDSIPAASAKTYYVPAVVGLPEGFGGPLMIAGRPGAQLSAVVNDVR